MTSVCLLAEGTYPYVTGGVSTWAASLVGELDDVAWSVAHLCDRAPAAGRPALPAQVRVLLDVPVRRGWGPVPGPREAARLARLLPDVDVYHATAVGAASAVARSAAGARGGGFLLTEHGTAWREAELAGGPLETGRRAPNTRGSRRRWVRALQVEATRAYAAADAVTAVSQAGARLQESLGAEAPLVLPHPPVDRPRQERQPDDPPLVVLVGRVVPLKDVATFVRACAAVARARPDCTFAVVGPLDADPAYARHCQDLVVEEGLDGRLHLTGQSDVAPWYRRAAVVVSTSRSEARPFALLEAMQAGAPVVTTDVGDCASMVASPGLPAAGLVVPPGDAGAAAAAVLRVLSSADLGEALGRAGRGRTSALPTAREHAQAYGELYRRYSTRAGAA